MHPFYLVPILVGGLLLVALVYEYAGGRSRHQHKQRARRDTH